jgi:hypothetical protein
MVDGKVFRFSHFDEQGHPHWTFHPGPLLADSGQPSEVRERAPPRYAARRPGVLLGSPPFG